MCSGKVYYELAKKRADLKKEKEVAIIRLEQVGTLHSCFVNQSCSSSVMRSFILTAESKCLRPRQLGL